MGKIFLYTTVVQSLADVFGKRGAVVLGRPGSSENQSRWEKDFGQRVADVATEPEDQG